jgi:transposase InsO family protein
MSSGTYPHCPAAPQMSSGTSRGTLLGDVRSKVIRLPVRSPNLNAYAERWMRTVREECLDRVIVLNENHLRWVLRAFVRYYNERRPHRALDLRPPEGPVECCGEGDPPSGPRRARERLLPEGRLTTQTRS